MAVSYAQKLADAKIMVDALRKNTGQVTKIDPVFITDMELLKMEVETLNTEQEKLKADLKSKTEQLNSKVKSLTEKYNFAKKRVKMDIPQTQWKEYGILDSK